jgi:hypothetical protein
MNGKGSESKADAYIYGSYAQNWQCVYVCTLICLKVQREVDFSTALLPFKI